MRRSFNTLATAAFWLVALLLPNIAHGFACLTTMHNQGGPCLHWAQGGATLTSFLGIPSASLINGTLTWDQNAISAANEWNAVGAAFHFSINVGGVFNEPCGQPGPGHACFNAGPAGDNPVIFRNTFCGTDFGDIVELTNNCFNPNSGAMINAPVFVNGSIPWNAYDGPIIFSNGQVINDVRRVLLHEFGHVIGLDHPDAHGQGVAAIMNSHESDLDRLQSDDKAGAFVLYPHSSSSGSDGTTNQGCQIGAVGDSGSGWMLCLPAIFGLILRRRGGPGVTANADRPRR